MKSIAVILINYNSLGDTKKCVESILRSDIKNNCFIVIVDNNSDNSEELEKEYENQSSKIKIIFNEENIGFARANNAGIHWALKNIPSLEFIFLLNNDTTVEFTTISTLISASKKYNSVGITTCKIVYMDEPNKIWYGGGEVSRFLGKINIFGYNKDFDSPEANTEKFVSFVSGCAMLIGKPVIENVGMLNEKFFMYGEDLEYSLRLKRKGYKILYTPKTTIKHRLHGSSNDNEIKFPALHRKNKNLVFYTYHFTKNTLLATNMHFKSTNKVVFNIYYFLKTSLRVLQYLFYFRLKAVHQTLLAYKDYWIENK